MNDEGVPLQRYSPQPGTTGTTRCSVHSVPSLFRHAQISDDNLSNFVLFHVWLTCNHSNSQLRIATHYLPYPLNVDLSPAC